MVKPRALSIWTIDELTLRHIIDTSDTQSEVIERCGSKPKGTSPFRALQAKCREFDIDLESLRERSRSKVKKSLVEQVQMQKIALSDILVEHSSYNTGHLKKRLISDGILQNKCSMCGSPPEWFGELLVMVLDHINGISDDHRINNLRLLCPNCNSQTSTFCGRMVDRSYRERVVADKNRLCSNCGGSVGETSKTGMCSRCVSIKRRKVVWPTYEELSSLLSVMSMVEIGKQYGVSDNAVRKWAKSYKLL